MKAQVLQYGDQRIPYQVMFCTQKIGKLSIHVLPTGVVCVEAPQGTPLGAVKQAVTRRARWISGHLRAAGAHRGHLSRREYVSGESHLYLGRRYLLKVRQSDFEDPSVVLYQGRFRVMTPEHNPDLIGAMMAEWYRQRARVVFAERMASASSRLPWLGELPRWKLLAMKRQWGSCSPTGIVSLNPHLIKASPLCIDYVLLHELCHIRFHNHSDDFYRLLTQYMPNWQSVKKRLDGLAEQIFIS